MFNASQKILRMLATTVWVVGAIVLLSKACYLLWLATVSPISNWLVYGTALGGSTIGLLKGRIIFTRFNKNNLERINQLKRPRIWQFFSSGFFVALAAMVFAGAALSTLADHNEIGLVIVAGLDMAIGTALVTSIDTYWTLNHPSATRS